MNKELRFLSGDVKTKDDTRTVSGYAAKFDSESKDLGGFAEIIKQGAFSNVLQSNPDVIANINHNDSQVLAVTNNNLELKEDRHGLWFEFDVPETTYGNDLLVNVRAGNVSKCSFAFSVGKDSWERRSGKTPLRVIYSVNKLYDVALVTIPAYEDTSIALRSLKDFNTPLNAETKIRIAKVNWV